MVRPKSINKVLAVMKNRLLGLYGKMENKNKNLNRRYNF